MPRIDLPSQGMPICLGPNQDEYHKALENEIQIAKNLTDALFNYLTLSARLQLVQNPFQMPKPTTEDLMRQIEQRDRLTSQIEQLENSLVKLPEQLKGIFEFSVISLIRDQLSFVEQQITRMQAAMEEPAV